MVACDFLSFSFGAISLPVGHGSYSLGVMFSLAFKCNVWVVQRRENCVVYFSCHLVFFMYG